MKKQNSFAILNFLEDDTSFLIRPNIHGAHAPQDSPICKHYFRLLALCFLPSFRTLQHNILFSLSAYEHMSMSMSNCRTRRCRNVCLFGLSADPPTGTGGHVGIVQALTSLLRSPAATAQDDVVDGVDVVDVDVDGAGLAFDEIRVLPVYRHTYADKRQRLESFEHRYNMCRAAFGNMARVTVSDAEYKSWLAAVQDVPPEKRDQVSVGTAALIEYLQNHQNKKHKQDDKDDDKDDDDDDELVEEVYSFVMGADTFLDLTAGKWKESARVLDLLQGRLVVLERETANSAVTATATATAASTGGGDDNAAANTAAAALKKAVEAVPGARLLRVDHLNHVSSSQVRDCRSGVVEIQEQNMVVPAVLDYMRQHGLYYAAAAALNNNGDTNTPAC